MNARGTGHRTAPATYQTLGNVIGSSRHFGQCAHCGKQFMSTHDRVAVLPNGYTYVCDRCAFIGPDGFLWTKYGPLLDAPVTGPNPNGCMGCWLGWELVDGRHRADVYSEARGRTDNTECESKSDT